MSFKYARLLRFIGLFIGFVVGIVLLVSLVASCLLDGEFLYVLRICLFIGGALVLGVGALTGAGFSEGKIYRAAIMTGGHQSNYYSDLQKERLTRREDEFYFMLLMAASGIILMSMAFLLGL